MPEGSGADGAQSCSKCCLLTRQEAAGPQLAVRDKQSFKISHSGAESGMVHSIVARFGCDRVQAGAQMCMDVNRQAVCAQARGTMLSRQGCGLEGQSSDVGHQYTSWGACSHATSVG